MSSNGYPLDLGTPIRHVATELERVAPAALSLDELVANYRHPVRSDFSRVMKRENCVTEDDALRWLVRFAVEEIRQRGRVVQVVGDETGYRFADGIGFDDLRWQRRKLNRLVPDPEPHFAGGRDPFDPMSGSFSDNVGIASRRLDKRDASLGELRKSMRDFGWLPQLPAIKDERGVVLMGMRRLAVAEELGIEPVVQVVKLGQGDEADAERFKLAIGSNLGFKPFTRDERQRIAAYLYGEKEWSQERIAEVLNVSQMTVSRDLTAKHVSNRGEPKYTRVRTPEKDALVRQMTDEGKPRDEIMRSTDYGSSTVDRVRAEMRGERRVSSPSQQSLVEEPQVSTCRCPECGHQHQVSR